jgi:hypothetical protein
MKTIKKWFWVWQQDQEKQFLEEQARKGLILVEVRFFNYIFEEGNPQDLVYQIDFRGLGGKVAEAEYLQIFEDAGWKFIPSKNGWYYFYQEKSVDNDLTLFNDNESRRKVYIRLIGFLALTGFPLYFYLLYNIPRLEVSGFFTGLKLGLGIFMVFVLLVHLFAVVKILSMYQKLKKNIKE